MTDKSLLQIISAAISFRGVLKKDLARRCGVSKPRFSEMLHGDRPIPPEVRDTLLRELRIEKTWQRLSATAD